jgi:hypothetical protein
MLFIIQHQTTEFWLKLVLHELDSARVQLAADDLSAALKRVARDSVENHIVPMRQFRGYLYHDGRFTPINFPGSAYTLPTDVNDCGQIVGAALNRERTAGISFLREADGTSMRLPDPPGSLQTVAIEINNKGQIVGAFAIDPPNDRPRR